VVTVDDIAGAVGGRLAATAGWSAAVPGGVHLGRGPDSPTDYPYAVVDVVPSDAEVFSGDISLQRFEVRVGVYCPSGDPAGGAKTAGELLNLALASSAGNAAMQASALRNANDKILHCLPRRPEGDFADPLRGGRDVWRAGVVTDVLTQSDRGVA